MGGQLSSHCLLHGDYYHQWGSASVAADGWDCDRVNISSLSAGPPRHCHGDEKLTNSHICPHSSSPVTDAAAEAFCGEDEGCDCDRRTLQIPSAFLVGQPRNLFSSHFSRITGLRYAGGVCELWQGIPHLYCMLRQTAQSKHTSLQGKVL